MRLLLVSGSVMFVADNIVDSLFHGMIHYDEITSTGGICCTFSWKLKDYFLDGLSEKIHSFSKGF